jgi:hypothetical protein
VISDGDKGAVHELHNSKRRGGGFTLPGYKIVAQVVVGVNKFPNLSSEIYGWPLKILWLVTLNPQPLPFPTIDEKR